MIPDTTSAVGMADALLRLRQSPIMDDSSWLEMVTETLTHEEMKTSLADEIRVLIEDEAGPLERVGE